MGFERQPLRGFPKRLGKAVLALCGIAMASGTAHAQFRSLENPSFEANDPAGAGAPNYEILPIASVPGWDTSTGEIELWDSNFNGVPAFFRMLRTGD